MENLKWFFAHTILIIYILVIVYCIALMIVYNHYITAAIITILLMFSVTIKTKG